MDWITDQIAIGDCYEEIPAGLVELDLRYIPDHQAISREHLDALLDVIRALLKADGKVFIHCIGGISRSPSVVATYLALERGITVDAAFDHIRARRSIMPHPDQVQSVREFVALKTSELPAAAR